MRSDDPRLADITRVLEAHVEELMAVPGVVGVALGLLEDGTTPCLTVMVAERTGELEARLPASLGGHPLVIEETGPLRPLDGR